MSDFETEIEKVVRGFVAQVADLARRAALETLSTALGSSAVLVAIVQTPGVSHFFGCTPLGPVAWTGVIGATAGATALSVLAPNFLAKTAGMVQPELAEATDNA